MMGNSVYSSVKLNASEPVNFQNADFQCDATFPGHGLPDVSALTLGSASPVANVSTDYMGRVFTKDFLMVLHFHADMNVSVMLGTNIRFV